jgi:hypothetical protein
VRIENEPFTAGLAPADWGSTWMVMCSDSAAEREDGRIAAWGMAFEDHTAVLRDQNAWLSVSSSDRARHMLSRAPAVTAHLIWVRPLPALCDPSGTGHA